ncbi:MAG: glycosyltransferase family 4 protein, partial [Armatimonadota bacterium]
MSGPISHETHRASRRGRKRPFRILLLSAYFPPEIGTASHLFHELAAEFASRGHAVTVATGFPRYNVPPDVAARHRGIWRTEDVDGIRVLRVWWPRFPRRMMIGRGIEHFLAAAAVALRAIASSRPDVLLVYSPPLTLGLSAALLGALRQTRFILNVQDLFPQSAIDLGVMRNRAQIAFFRRMESFIYRQADCVTVHSDGNAEYVSAASGGSAPVAVVPNWVDNRLLEPRPKAPWLLGLGDLRDRFVVSFAGTMGLSQDVETIVRAARLLRDRKDIVFLL